jgi:hypothetical protein
MLAFYGMTLWAQKCWFSMKWFFCDFKIYSKQILKTRAKPPLRSICSPVRNHHSREIRANALVQTLILTYLLLLPFFHSTPCNSAPTNMERNCGRGIHTTAWIYVGHVWICAATALPELVCLWRRSRGTCEVGPADHALGSVRPMQ